MDVLNKKDNQIVFRAETNESLANAVRRYLNKVPVMAVDEVEIVKNGSALYDETVAHRIGLIPLKTEKALTDKSEAKFKLSTNKEGVVSSGELKGNADLVYENIPITYLDKDQELELVASARVGQGSEHVKFSPGLLFYRNVQEIIVDKGLVEEIKKACPDVTIKEKGDKIVVIDDQVKEVGDVIEGIAERMGKKAEVEAKPGLVLTLESFGQLDLKDIFEKAVTAIKKDLAEISKNLK